MGHSAFPYICRNLRDTMHAMWESFLAGRKEARLTSTSERVSLVSSNSRADADNNNEKEGGRRPQ